MMKGGRSRVLRVCRTPPHRIPFAMHVLRTVACTADAQQLKPTNDSIPRNPRIPAANAQVAAFYFPRFYSNAVACFSVVLIPLRHKSTVSKLRPPGELSITRVCTPALTWSQILSGEDRRHPDRYERRVSASSSSPSSTIAQCCCAVRDRHPPACGLTRVSLVDRLRSEEESLRHGWKCESTIGKVDDTMRSPTRSAGQRPANEKTLRLIFQTSSQTQRKEGKPDIMDLISLLLLNISFRHSFVAFL